MSFAFRRAPRRQSSLRRAITETLERRSYMAANLVISEFLASNDHSLTDGLNNHEDWIEIHNTGDATANLNDYCLTDSATLPQQWRFPTRDLLAGGYLVVFASGRNITTGTELHTNFKLSADGEYLGLIHAADDSVQFEYAPKFPAQSTDVSYGLADANNPAGPFAYSISPTPGAQNAPSTSSVTYSTTGKVFSGSLSITLSSSTPGAVIHYTLDRSLPTATSPVYTAAIPVTSTTQIRALAIASPYANSPVTSQSYISADATTAAFNSNLPVVVLDSFGQTFNDQAAVSATATFVNTGANGRAQADSATPDFSGRIGLRYRGSTSYLNYPKKPFAVETQDENNADKDVSILGLPSDSDWILYSPYTERSLMNNQLAMLWANETGHYASRTRFVELYLNTTAGASVTQSNYLGVYILMEKPKIGADRVDITKLKPTDTGGDGFSGPLSGGYFFKKDRVETTEKSFTTTGIPGNGQKFAMVDPDETEVTQNQLDAINAYMTAFEKALYGIYDPAHPNAVYSDFIDVDSFVDYFIVDEMTRNVDGYWLSTFYSKDRDSKLKIGPAWDFNLGFGETNYNESSNAQGYNTDFNTAAQNPYFKKLLLDPNFVQKLSDRWQPLRAGVFSNAALNGDINRDIALLSDNSTNYPVGTYPTQPSTNPLVRNFQRWAELGTYVTTTGFYDLQGRWIEDVNLMRNWIMARVDWMDSQFVAAPAISPGGSFLGSTNVTLTPRSKRNAVDTVLIAGSTSSSKYFLPSPSSTLSGWQLPAFNDASWSNGTGGIGYDTITTDVNFLPAITTNVQAAMKNVTNGIFTRYTFTLTQAQLDSFEHLVLQMKYDDGFTAWVNGVRIADLYSGENIVPTAATLASKDRTDNEVLTFKDYDISAIKNLLVVGTNVLAIQGMNIIRNSNDFLLLPQLVLRSYQSTATGSIYYTTDGSDPRASGGGVSTSAVPYTGAISLNTSKRVRARTLVNGLWSGIADQTYDFTPDTLRVSELMYHPTVDENFEYLEVQNIGTAPLDLSGYAFTTGIAFTFPAATLAPGAYGVIVKNLASFNARYGSSANVLGTYTGSLDNSGERIVLSKTINSVVTEVQNFVYDDDGPGWYPSTDGPGYSLVFRDTSVVDKSQWSSAAAWRASYSLQGSPGVADDVDSIAPAISSAVYGVGGNLAVQFSEAITITAAAGWTLTELLTSATVTPTSITAAGKVATIALPSLANGVYRLNIAANAVGDYGANPLASAFAWTLLLVKDGQSLVLPANSPAYLVDQFTLGVGAKLDLKNNALAIRNGDVGTWSASGYSGLTGSIVSGRNGGTWDGAGIGTSMATTETTIGISSAAQALNIAAAQTSAWQGLTVGPGDVLIRYTLGGDATLDGTVNFDDLVTLSQNYNAIGRSYASGNFDYSAGGEANFDDLVILSQHYNQTLPPPAIKSPAATAPASRTPDIKTPAATKSKSPAVSRGQ